MSSPKSVVCLQDGTPVPVMEDARLIAERLGLAAITTQTGATLYINRDHIVFVGEHLPVDDAEPKKLELL